MTTREGGMRHLRFGPGLTIFVLFFGIALVDAFAAREWLRATFWCVVGLGFAVADSARRRP